MKLLVDIGNTALKWAQFSDGLLETGTSLSTGEGLAGELEGRWEALPVPEQILVSDVGSGRAFQTVADWSRRHWRREPRRVRSCAEAHGVINAYRDPERLGVDRWLALVAARSLDTTPALIVDCGSAATVDVLDGRGRHLGGLIVPGLGLARRCLEQHTQVRIDEAVASEVALLARDTAGAVRGGGLYALVAFVDRLAEDVEAALGAPLRRLITGGDAPAVVPLLRNAYEHRPDLVLEGLAVLARGDP